MQQQLTVFSKLPARLADGLALGSVGKGHLLRLARLALASPGNEALGQELALAAWEADPLDGELAAQLEPVVSGVDTRTLQCIRDVRINWQRPQRPEYYQRLLQKRDMDRIFTYLYSQHEKEPQNLFWLQQALGMAAYEGAFDWLSSWLGKGNYPQALEKKIQGDLAFFQKSYDAAAAYYLAAWDFGGLHPALVRHAESLFRLGDTDNAIALGREALAVRPWQTNQLLTLHDRLTGLSGERTALPGQVAVLLYSYNKADDLRRTLDTLVPQLPASASVFVLDNGSSDDTAALLAGWEEQFSRTAGEARFQSIRLPVNIGAPAARNWLVAMEAARPYEWLAFLDDDALPPAGWLDSLGQAVSVFPQAGVWGCRVVDARNPLLIQSADTHLTDPPQPSSDGLLPAYQRLFGLSRIHNQDLDFGQFDYLRPCVSVTGCCHLFRRSTLEQSKGFDLRFTPSQYDDVEHDLRLALEGKTIVYQGHLRVEHCKRTGRLGQEDPQELARALGNMYKLQMKFEPEQIARLRRERAAELHADLLEKAAHLRASGLQLDFWT